MRVQVPPRAPEIILKWRFTAFFAINREFALHGAYGVIAAQKLVELLDSERNRIGTQQNLIGLL